MVHKIMKEVEKTKKFWSKSWASRAYRKFAGKRFRKIHERVTEIILKRNAKDVLDIACGSGDFLFFLSQKTSNINLVGTDISPGMVKNAAEKLKGKAEILEAKGTKQPFTKNTFDIVTAMMVLHHIENKLEFLKNTKKLLKKEGALILLDVVAKSERKVKLWNFLEKLIVRGYTGHYTEENLEYNIKKAGFDFEKETIPGKPKRNYKIYKLFY